VALSEQASGRKDFEMSEVRDLLVDAIVIMDESGRKNPEGNSTMLWERQWNDLRMNLFRAIERIDLVLSMEESLERPEVARAREGSFGGN